MLGTYHGHYDALMVGVGAGYGPGIPAGTTDRVHAIEFNDAETVERRIYELERDGHTPACVILEGVMTHVGLALPHEGYLKAVRVGAVAVVASTSITATVPASPARRRAAAAAVLLR